MTDLEEATLRLREAIDILEHPEHVGCHMEAMERIEDALGKLKNVEDVEDQLEKANAYIKELQEARRMQKARPTDLTKHFNSLDIEPPGEEPEEFICPTHGRFKGFSYCPGCKSIDLTRKLHEPHVGEPHPVVCKRCGHVSRSDAPIPHACGPPTEEIEEGGT